MSTNNKILVIGDCHVTNKQSLRRFKWLGNYIKENIPDYLVFMGDFLTLNSLSAWDRDKRLLMEGRRFFQEIDAGNEALDLLELGQYENITKVFIHGNHEDRLTRYVQTHPELADERTTVASLLQLKERGFQCTAYRDYTRIGGIDFTHIPFGKAREVSGKDICSKAEQVTVNSVVFGHTHELHTSCVHKEGQKHLQQILNVGCFFEEDEEYVQGHMTQYWRGVVLLENYSYGRFDINTIALSHLRRQYGK